MTVTAPRRPPTNPGRRFINVEAPEASGDTVPLPARKSAVDVNLQRLPVTDEDRQLLQQLYDEKKTTERTYGLEEASQIAAAAFLASVELDVHARELTGSRWSCVWSKRSRKTEKTLLQWCAAALLSRELGTHISSQ